MSFSNKALTKVFLAFSLVIAGNAASALPNSSLRILPQSNIVNGPSRLSLLQVENKSFNTRLEALNAVKDRGAIPRSQQFITQWEKGSDTSRAGNNNYVLEKTRQAAWGNYYLYKIGSRYFVVAEHINDPNAPCPTGWTKPCKHFHVGTTTADNHTKFSQSTTPDNAAISFFKSQDYDQIQPDHHFFYKAN